MIVIVNEYVELLTKIKDVVNPQMATDGLYDVARSVIFVTVFVSASAMFIFIILDVIGKSNKFIDYIKGMSVLVAIASTFTMVFYGYVALSRFSLTIKLSTESKTSILNYVIDMNDQEYSRLEKLVKLYGNQFSDKDKIIEQINKNLAETVGK